MKMTKKWQWEKDNIDRDWPWAGELYYAKLYTALLEVFTIKRQQRVLGQTLQGSNGLSLQLWKSLTKGSLSKDSEAAICEMNETEMREYNSALNNSSSDVTGDPQQRWLLNEVSLLNVTAAHFLSSAWPRTPERVGWPWCHYGSVKNGHHHTAALLTSTTCSKQHSRCYGSAQKSPAENRKWKRGLAWTSLGFSVLFLAIWTETWCIWLSVACTKCAKIYSPFNRSTGGPCIYMSVGK